MNAQTKQNKAMSFDLAARVRRLPAPHNGHTALLPVLEAISNSFISIEELFKEKIEKKGRITVKMSGTSKRFSCSVTDNGTGMTEENFNAFCMVDTLHGVEKGRKGVGRLLWLAAFKKTDIESIYAVEKTPKGSITFSKRSFKFGLGESEPITDFVEEPLGCLFDETKTKISFSGILPEYARKIPVTKAGKQSQEKLNRKAVEDIICSQFFPYLLNKEMGRLILEIDGQHTDLSEKVQNSIVRKETVTTKVEGHPYTLLMMECLAEDVPSSGKRNNLIYLAGNDRIVKQEDIDTVMGIKNAYHGTAGQKVKFRAILTSPVLDGNVNQERTDFTGDAAKLQGKDIVEMFHEPLAKFLQSPLADLRKKQRNAIKSIVGMYPSVLEGNIDHMLEILEKQGYGYDDPNHVYAEFSRRRFIRDKKRSTELEKVIADMRRDGTAPDLSERISTIRAQVSEADRNSLSEYVTRRKAFLNLMKEGLTYVTTHQTGRDADYAKEDILHSLLCPMRETSIGTKPAFFSHDLWVIDERLTFTQFLSSDVPQKEILQNSDSKKRPDLIVFDQVKAFMDKPKNPDHIMIVEFKRPGRTHYTLEENPVEQIKSYRFSLIKDNVKGPDGRPVAITEDCTFDCFIIADRLGKLEEWTDGWFPNPKEGRWLAPSERYKGSIELITWDQLLEDAEMRNRPFFEKLGISNS